MISFRKVKKRVLFFTTLLFLSSCGSFHTKYKCPPTIVYTANQEHLLARERAKAGSSEPITDFVLEDYHKSRFACNAINQAK